MEELRGGAFLQEAMDALWRISGAVAAQAASGRVLQLVAAETATVFGASVALVVRYDEERGDGVVEGRCAAPGSGAARLGTRLAMAPPVTRGADPTADAPDVSATTPVRIDGRFWGVLGVGFGAEDPPPEVSDRLGRFADLVTLAVASVDGRDRLARLASTDSLTGLSNRREFSERLEEEIRRARRPGRALSLVVFDLDNFKAVNDTHGPLVGNRVLREVAGRLVAQRRGGEVVARVGGEEFAWILPETDGAGAYAAAERGRARIGAEPFPGVGRLTASAGVCELSEAGNAGELFRLADVALYWAKAQGRDRSFRYASDAIELLPADEQARRLERARTLALLQGLARAIDAKDASTRAHSERVAQLARSLAGAAGWPDERAELLAEAALVHDVGKIGVPDAILLKPGVLTPDEYEQVKQHAALGAEIVNDALSLEQAAWVRHHHERWDGSGYPEQLAGDAIPEGARLLALADAWDAMTAARIYRPPLALDDAFADARSARGAQFAPEAVDALEQLWDAGRIVSAEPAAAAGPAQSPSSSRLLAT